MKTNTDAIRVRKKAVEMVESITDNAGSGGYQYTVVLVNGETYSSNNAAKVQKFISERYRDDFDNIIAEGIARLDEQRKAIDAEVLAKQVEAKNKAKDKRAQTTRQKELKAQRNARYRAKHLEELRAKDREYRRKKRAMLKKNK